MERLLSLRRNISDIASPPRNTDYKKKGNGIDKRAMRLHRRSIDQRKMRDMTLLKQRNIDAMSPLKEVQNKEPQKTGKQQQQNDMKDRLKKWKEEKELKKKLQRQKQQPMFKVQHIQYEKTPFVAQQESKSKSLGSRRVTRSATRASRSENVASSSATAAYSKPVTRQSRPRQKEQPQPLKSTSIRTTRRGKISQPATSQPQPARTTRVTRSSSAKKPQQAQEPPQHVSSRVTRSTKTTQKQKVEEEELPVKTTQNAFNKSSINFERGEPTVSFLENASFAPINFKFDFTMGLSNELNGSNAVKTPSRRCSSTPLSKVKTGHIPNLSTPQGLSAIRPKNDFKAPTTRDKSLPVLCMSSSESVSSPQDSVVNLATFLVSHAHVDNLPVVKSQLETCAETTLDQESSSENSTDKTAPSIPFEEDSLESRAQTATQVTAESQNAEVPVISVPEESEHKDENVAEDVPPETEVNSEEKSHEVPTDAEEKIESMDTEEKKAETQTQALKERGVDEQKEIDNVKDEVETSRKEAEEKATLPTEETKEAKEEEKDVPYFRRLLCSETERLTKLCDKWQAVMEGNQLNDDVLGEIRSTIGKAQLLMDQRFKQFSGLVDNCEFNLGEKKTHCTDLIGFWEMVAYQVEDVEKMFVDLDKLQANNWVKEETIKTQPKPKKAIKKKTQKPKSSGVSKKVASERNAARQRLMAAKAAMKAKATRSKDNDKVVFEGGFFKVESPVRSPKVHCEAGSPLSAAFLRRTSNTPGSKPGSRQGTPRSQVFTPRNPCLSLQNKLCTPLSKLVLAETNSVATTTPGRTTRSRQGTPEVKAGPCTPHAAKVCGNEVHPSAAAAKTPKSCKVSPKQNDSTQQQLLIPGVNSPHISEDNMISNALSIFTPAPKTTPPKLGSSSTFVSDLICLDSPLAPTSIPPLAPTSIPAAAEPTVNSDAMGSLKCFAAINATPDMKELLGTDVVMSPVRRSARRHHASGPAQMVVEKLADMPDKLDYGYQPNSSLL